MSKKKKATITIGVWPFQKKLKMTLPEIRALIKDLEDKMLLELKYDREKNKDTIEYAEQTIQMLKDTVKDMEKDIHE